MKSQISLLSYLRYRTPFFLNETIDNLSASYETGT